MEDIGGRDYTDDSLSVSSRAIYSNQAFIWIFITQPSTPLPPSPGRLINALMATLAMDLVAFLSGAIP
jgi:hypothetical protein